MPPSIGSMFAPSVIQRIQTATASKVRLTTPQVLEFAVDIFRQLDPPFYSLQELVSAMQKRAAIAKTFAYYAAHAAELSQAATVEEQQQQANAAAAEMVMLEELSTLLTGTSGRFTQALGAAAAAAAVGAAFGPAAPIVSAIAAIGAFIARMLPFEEKALFERWRAALDRVPDAKTRSATYRVFRRLVTWSCEQQRIAPFPPFRYLVANGALGIRGGITNVTFIMWQAIWERNSWQAPTGTPSSLEFNRAIIDACVTAGNDLNDDEPLNRSFGWKVVVERNEGSPWMRAHLASRGSFTMGMLRDNARSLGLTDCGDSLRQNTLAVT